jgi:hypothetical protein
MTRLYEVWGAQVDFVNGYKISRSDPFHRVIIGRLYHWTVKLAYGLHLRDGDCDFRLMRRSDFEVVAHRLQQRLWGAGHQPAFDQYLRPLDACL